MNNFNDDVRKEYVLQMLGGDNSHHSDLTDIIDGHMMTWLITKSYAEPMPQLVRPRPRSVFRADAAVYLTELGKLWLGITDTEPPAENAHKTDIAVAIYEQGDWAIELRADIDEYGVEDRDSVRYVVTAIDGDPHKGFTDLQQAIAFIAQSPAEGDSHKRFLGYQHRLNARGIVVGDFVRITHHVDNHKIGKVDSVDVHGVHLDTGDDGKTMNGFTSVEPEWIEKATGNFVRYCPKCKTSATPDANNGGHFCKCGHAMKWHPATDEDDNEAGQPDAEYTVGNASTSTRFNFSVMNPYNEVLYHRASHEEAQQIVNILNTETEHLRARVAELEAERDRYYRWSYQMMVAWAKELLQEANDNRTSENEWPAGQEWGDLVPTSKSMFLRQVREKAEIDHDAYLEPVRDCTIDVDDLFD